MGKKAMMMGALLLLAGCTVTSVDLHFEAIEPVNKESADATESGVVQVRIFQLKDKAKFEQAESEDIWNNPDQTLGGDLIQAIDGDPIYPEKPDGNAFGKTIKIDPLNSETKFIGVLAMMYQKDDVGKRHVAVTIEEADDVVFRITGYHVELRK
jgi:type VI secretion system VasD/TssJ family lipoprotein